MSLHRKAIKINKKNTDRAATKHSFLLQHINNLHLFKQYKKKKVTATTISELDYICKCALVSHWYNLLNFTAISN